MIELLSLSAETLGYQSEALRHPACSDESKLADERYAAVVRKASIRLEEIECGHQEAGSHAYCELRDSTSLLQRCKYKSANAPDSARASCVRYHSLLFSGQRN